MRIYTFTFDGRRNFFLSHPNAKKQTSSSLVYKQQIHINIHEYVHTMYSGKFVKKRICAFFEKMLCIYIFHFILFLFHICIKQFLMKMNICDRLVFMYIFVWSALTHFVFVSSSSFEWNYIRTFQFFRLFKSIGKFFFLVCDFEYENWKRRLEATRIQCCCRCNSK